MQLAGVDLVEIAARVWPGRRAHFDVLGGGITNHNVKVELGDGEAYVLRIAGRDTAVLGIDRLAEHEASLAAAAVGVGPIVVALLEPEGWLVTRFIEGTSPTSDEMREPAMIARVAAALRAVHAGPRLPRRFDSFGVVEEYYAAACARDATVPAAYTWARELARTIAHRRGAVPERPCHNDLLTANFIDDGKRIRIVDWEYAGMGDIFFDLANLAVNHEFGPGEHERLLGAYFGTYGAREQQALELMRFMSDFREAMWGVVQGAISSLEFDFEAYARHHFERLERTAAESAFERALAGA